jgi:hypothetical protein
MISKIFFAIFLVVASTQISHAEVVELTRGGPTCSQQFENCSLGVQIRGEITAATVEQLNRLIEKTRGQAEAAKYSFQFDFAELDSRGGAVDAAMAIGRILRKEEAGAFVSQGAVCLSSCVFILAGGVTRSFQGSVGIHRPYFEVPSGDVSSQNIKAQYGKMLQDLRAYFREMNVAEGLADAMLLINPENVRLLSKAELDSYGLTDTDPIWKEAFELQEAKRYGLNRQEYMRRTAYAESACQGQWSAILSANCRRFVLEKGIPAPTPQPKPGEVFDPAAYGTPAK